MTAGGQEGPFLGEGNVLKLDCVICSELVIAVQLDKLLKLVNFMVCKLYLSKTLKNKARLGVKIFPITC